MKINGTEHPPRHDDRLPERPWIAVKAVRREAGQGTGLQSGRAENIVDGRKLNNRFGSDEKVEQARVEVKDYQFPLPSRTTISSFMDADSYEQIELATDFVGERPPFCKTA